MKYDPIEQARLIYEAQPTAYNASAYQLAMQLAAMKVETEQNLKAAKEDRANAKSEMLFYTSMADKYRWQPIETAPHDGTWILVTGFRQQHNGPISHMFAVAAFFPRSEKNPTGPYEWFYGTKREQYIDSPTHWMPLPNQLPPKPVKPKRQLQVVTLPKRNIKKP